MGDQLAVRARDDLMGHAVMPEGSDHVAFLRARLGENKTRPGDDFVRTRRGRLKGERNARRVVLDELPCHIDPHFRRIEPADTHGHGLDVLRPVVAQGQFLVIPGAGCRLNRDAAHLQAVFRIMRDIRRIHMPGDVHVAVRIQRAVRNNDRIIRLAALIEEGDDRGRPAVDGCAVAEPGIAPAAFELALLQHGVMDLAPAHVLEVQGEGDVRSLPGVDRKIPGV
ncbi:MAG: hypothetical protein FWF90_16380, partial [Promicromonosporaceae bacterium]|nr:hypothetical protein [Promicromonosporaceae bacterium]